MQHARDRVGAITARSRLGAPPQEIVADLNRFLHGWSGYFRYGNSARSLLRIRNHAINRLALLEAKRHKQHRHYGWKRVVHESPDMMGLINLNGRVVAPRPNRDWREKPNAAGERRR